MKNKKERKTNSLDDNKQLSKVSGGHKNANNKKSADINANNEETNFPMIQPAVRIEDAYGSPNLFRRPSGFVIGPCDNKPKTDPCVAYGDVKPRLW